MGVNWDNVEVINKFEEMILVSQAADVQLDFMRRICPEYTARQTLQELVIYLTEVFAPMVEDEEGLTSGGFSSGSPEGGLATGVYVTLDIPILNKERNYVLKMCSNTQGGCDVKEQKMGGLCQWILDTGKSVNTPNVIDGNEYYDKKLDHVPLAITQPHTSDDYKGYFGFYLAPFDANDEEKMCIVVGIRLTRPVLPKEEAMVRGLTLTAMNGISFQQFGACAQIKGVLNSADLNRHVRAKIMYIEHGEGLFANGDVQKKQTCGGCGCGNFGSLGSLGEGGWHHAHRAQASHAS